MNEYRLVIVPEETRLTDQLLVALEEFARAGGIVLISGEYLARDYPGFVGASARGEAVTDSIYLPLGNRAVPVGPQWQPVTPSPGSEVLTYRLNQQEPDRNVTDQALVTRRPLGKGAIIAVHGPIFRNYFRGHDPSLREFVGNLVNRMGISWTAAVDGPPHLEMILRKKHGKLLVNLINRGSGETLGPSRVVVKELPPIENVVVRLRMDRPPRSVTVVPTDMDIHWSYQEGQVVINVPRVEIHRVLVVE